MVVPQVVRSRAELERALSTLRTGGRTVALVPTMGALHDGHVTLLEHASARADAVVASIFVNPTQFGPTEDLATYPRTFEADLARCALAGVDLVFAPDVETMYPEGTDGDGVRVDPGPLGTVLEGAARPTHFAGVLTVVAKLLGLVRPDVAVFGEKDFQQLALVRAMTSALCLSVDVQGCPTVREADGLAMSSRNRKLDDVQRAQARALSQALRAGERSAPHGPTAVLAAALAVLEAAEGVDLDYLELRSEDFRPSLVPGPARLLVAVRVGRTRLLDNIALVLGHEPGTE